MLAVSQSGTMDSFLMVDYIERVLKPAVGQNRALLILDEHASHYSDPTNTALAGSGIDSILIPGGYTSYLQPLDVSLNKPLKDA